MTIETTEKLVQTLPGEYYYDAAIYVREQERIFSALWVCVERADALPHTGDFLTADVGGQNIVVVRGRDRQLRGFYNACRHRGAAICTAERGTAKTLTCKYHAWTYSLDGRLQGAPNIASFGAFPREEFGLLPVALEVWEGLIWVNLADAPPPLATQIDPPIIERFGDLAQLQRYGIGELVLGKRIGYSVKANWKLVVENFMECYHCAPMHPELCELLPAFYNGTSYQGIVGVGTTFADDIAQFSMSGTGDRPRLPGLTDADERTYFGLTLAPNVLVSLLPDHVILHIAHPRGVDETYVTCDWLFAPGVVADPAFDPTDSVAIFDLVNRQDWEVCELTQRGVRSKAFARGGVYVPSEHHILQFNNLVRAQLGV